MLELTQRQKRLIARIATIDISRLKKWSMLGAIIFFGAAIGEYIYACVNHDYSIDFIRMLLLVTLGGGLIEHPRLFAMIQKLSQNPELKHEIAKIDVKGAQKRFWTMFILAVVVFWLLNHFFHPRIGI